MNEILKLKFKWSSDEAVSAFIADSAINCRKPFKYAANLIAMLAISGGVYRLTVFDWEFFPFALIAGGLYWLLLRRYDQAWSVRRKFKKRPDKDKIVNWAISTEELNSSVDGIGEASIKWDAISKVVHAQNGFVFYPNDQIHYWLPHTGFSNEKDIAKLISLAKTRGSEYIEMA